VLIIMVEPTLRSIEAARTIHALASELGIRRIGVVGNKIAAPAQRKFIETSLDTMESLGFLSLNERTGETDMTGEAVFSANPRLVDEVKHIRERIEQP
jgi:CO dehydrogenase maturation factor